MTHFWVFQQGWHLCLPKSHLYGPLAQLPIDSAEVVVSSISSVAALWHVMCPSYKRIFPIPSTWKQDSCTPTMKLARKQTKTRSKVAHHQERICQEGKSLSYPICVRGSGKSATPVLGAAAAVTPSPECLQFLPTVFLYLRKGSPFLLACFFCQQGSNSTFCVSWESKALCEAEVIAMHTAETKHSFSSPFPKAEGTC